MFIKRYRNIEDKVIDNIEKLKKPIIKYKLLYLQILRNGSQSILCRRS